MGFRPLILVGKPWQNNDFPVHESPTGWEWGLIVMQMYTFYHFLVAASLSLKVDDLFWWVPALSCQWLYGSQL